MNKLPSVTQNGGRKGLLIVIEGTDGSGKTTQYRAIKDRLTQLGYSILDIHFPRYENQSSFFVQQYLNGCYGSANAVSPYIGSLFFALDRYHAAADIRDAINQGKIVLCDRYVGSNMAHQGTKFDNPQERRGFFIWLDNLEYETLGIPRPDLNFVLNTPIDVITQRLATKNSSTTHIKKDIHETDSGHITKSIEVYNELCTLFPKDFHRIDSQRGDVLLSIQDVHKLIWEKVQALLPSETQHTHNFLIEDSNGIYTITEKGKDYLQSIVTNTHKDVYALTNYLKPSTIAAAMARLSRRGDDLRITLLDEFAGSAGKDKALLKRVITQYGDDSVQQLVGQHVVVENASNLLTKKLEWGRLAAYLEQSTRYIYIDKKTSDARYRYYVPEYLNKTLKNTYISTLDSIFDTYSRIVHALTDYIRTTSKQPSDKQDSAWKAATRAQACDTARPLLPVATTSTVGIFASGQAIESLIMRLLADELPEARHVGKQILDESRKVIPTFLERADKPERGGASIAYKANTRKAMQAQTANLLTSTYSSNQQAVTLTDYWPKNEIDLVADMLYEHTNLSLEEIRHQINQLSYDMRVDIFKTYMGQRLNRRHRPGRALEKAHYSWDLMCDYGIFRDLQRHRIVDDLEWQPLTPRFGYEIPELIEKAGLIDLFEACFDKSVRLCSELQAAGYELEAQYATLFGHKMRWKVTYNARQAFHLHELRTSPQGHPGYRKLVQQMHDKLGEVHPLIAQSMIFVNKDEDPQLTRLAAEQYAKFKLQQLDKSN